MASIGKVVGLLMAALGTLLGIWYRAVLFAPAAKRRKAARRAARRV